jgi:GNAT superfamily N-acetyltransferase
MKVRIARHTERLDEVVRFYRDGIGLPEMDSFRDHDGYDGVFLALPGTGTHLELTTGGRHPAPEPHPESLLVLYLGDDAAVRAVAARLDAEPVSSANPYWDAHATTFEDPDGFRVVLVPALPDVSRRAVEIDWHTGPRDELRGLFELAEDSAERLEASLDQGRVLVATQGGHVVGYLQLTGDELKSMAVAEDRQQQGIGRALVERAVRIWRDEGIRTVRVATATASVANLRFYQRLGFRMLEIERDAFTEADGYATGIVVDGIPLRDRVSLTLDLQRA